MTPKPTYPFLWLSLCLLILIAGILGFSNRSQVFAQSPDGTSEPTEGDKEALARQKFMEQFEADFYADLQSRTPLAATPCVGGFAGPYPCSNVDLLAFMPLNSIGAGSGSNDIWGWTDSLDGKEYALVGLTNGTSFVDVTDPENPVYLGRLPTQTSNSTWRDIKVYNDYAFIVSEASGHGMQVFDLTRLRNVVNPPVTFTNDTHYNQFGNAHNIAINEDTGYAYAIGSSTCAGGLHMVNIQNPLSPTNAGCYSGDGYTHDTQCVVYSGPDPDYQGNEICFSSNEDSVTVTDVTNKANPLLISRNTYAGSAYTHQGWLTEDQVYFLSDDELDEQNFGHNTRTRIWDMTDLDNPFIINFNDGPNPSIDHNLYTHDGNAYMSNYTSGLQIFDLSDVANGNLTLVAYFDSYTANNNATFNGSWSNYPYFESGTVIHTGIGEGLFITRPILDPGFSLFAAETVFSVCVAGEVATSLDLLDQNGYTGTVTLSTVNLPAGSAATFDPSSVIVPGSSTMTVTVSTTPAGMYPFTLLADDGTLTDTLDATLSIYETAPGATTLTSPTNGATDVPLQPTFTWDAVSGAASYSIDIATDAAFTNIVDSATVMGTNYTPIAALASSTTYYWRVTASNTCGDGAVSATFSFSTVDLLCRAPNLAIIDNTTVTDTFVVGSSGTLEDLNVSLLASHTYVGDILFTITHQDTGTSVTIVDRPGYTGTGFGCSGNNVDALLDDEGVDGPVENQCASDPALFGSPTPNNPLNAFDGEDLSGTWVMSVTDNAGGDTGTLQEWCLSPTLSTPANGALDGTVTDSVSGDPLVGATLSVTGWVTETTTDGSGQYSLVLPAGSYTVTASATGYVSETVTDILITTGMTTTQDFALNLLPVSTEADLNLSQTAPLTVTVGQTFTYTLTINNVGPATALSAILTDTLPAGVTFVSATTGCVEATGVVTCTLGDLTNGGTTVVEIVVTAAAAGTLSNAAEIGAASPDPDPSDNTASAQTEAVVPPPGEEFNIYLPIIARP